VKVLKQEVSMVKLGVNAWVWTSPVTTEELEMLAPKVAGMGFDWIEVPLERIGDLDYERGAHIIRVQGLGVSACAAMGPDRDLVHPDASIRENGMRYVRSCIDACEVLGATNLVGPIYSAVGRTWPATPEERARDTDLLVKNLRELAEYASDHGVTLCIEPLNRFETSFINLASQAIEVIDRVDHPACQILLDTFHMNIEEKSLGDAIRVAGLHLRHVHACENDRGAPGSGNIDWDDVAQGLRDIGYAGPVVIESFTAKVKTIARAAAIWRPLAETQDALAEEGLAFLRQLLTNGD
jgi:D-psicose/D-tagatose/L-ribulose 3-epimerase